MPAEEGTVEQVSEPLSLPQPEPEPELAPVPVIEVLTGPPFFGESSGAAKTCLMLSERQWQMS